MTLTELLASPRRAAILAALEARPGGGLAIGALAAAIGELQPNVSRDVARLQAAGFLTCEHFGRTTVVTRVRLSAEQVAFGKTQARILSGRYNMQPEAIASALHAISPTRRVPVTPVEVTGWLLAEEAEPPEPCEMN